MLDYASDERIPVSQIGENKKLLGWQILLETYSDTKPAEGLPSFSLII